MSTINLYNSDCLPAMKLMPDKAFELAIVDPPYGDNNFQGGGTHTKSNCKFGQMYRDGNGWNQVPVPEYFEELFRVSVNQIIWGGNYFNLGTTRGFIIWDKIRYIENFSQVEFAWTSFDRQPLLYRQCGNGGFITEAIDGPKISPTQKPVRLYEWLLKNYAKPGDKILDTHGGSCSLAIACDIMGFDADIWEIDIDYFNAAKERLERHQMQVSLPLEPEYKQATQEAIL